MYNAIFIFFHHKRKQRNLFLYLKEIIK